MKRRWTELEYLYLCENYETMTVNSICNDLGRTPDAVKAFAKRTGIKLSQEELKKRKVNSGKKLSYNNFGENNPNWKNGISKNNYHYKKLQKERYPEKVKARNKVHNALASGKIKKQPCAICGSQISFAHHDDYSKPLDVVWLCRMHHRERHNNLN